MGIDRSPEMKKAVLLGRDVVLNEAVVRDGRMAKGSPKKSGAGSSRTDILLQGLQSKRTP